jgi:hypothetical protein
MRRFTPSQITTFALLLSTAIFAYGFAGAFYTLLAVSDANKAQQRAFVCFDAQGRVTHGENWKECRMVAIRELRRRD